MADLSEPISRFIRTLTARGEEKQSDSKIVVNEAIGAIAFYYEKIRNVVDYQDEHLIRQNAIRRILGRRLITQQIPQDLAAGLLKELVRSRYFPNNTLSQSLVSDVEKILSLYMGVLTSLQGQKVLTDKDQDWLLSMASCAIDELLVPMDQEEALARLMYEMIEPHSANQGERAESNERTRTSQTFIAVYRILMRPDVNRLRYFLLKQSHPGWLAFDKPDVEHVAGEYPETVRKIDALIRHPLNKRLITEFRRYRIPFAVLFTILRGHTDPEGLLKNKEALEKEVKRVCEGFYQVQKRRLYSRAIRAFVYIFLTKMVLGLAIELPYDLLTIHHINGIPLLINIVFPPILLACIAFTVTFPGEENTNAIVQAVKEIVFKDEPRTIFVSHKVVTPTKKSPALYVVFSLLYLIVFGISFGCIGWILHKFDFNIVSGVIFFLFFSLITFFAINLRRQVRELIILKDKPRLGGIFVDTFFLPVIQVGRWLSFNISRVNVFVFLFDVLIELPLQALIEITEEWFAFIKEKKEEID